VRWGRLRARYRWGGGILRLAGLVGAWIAFRIGGRPSGKSTICSQRHRLLSLTLGTLLSTVYSSSAWAIYLLLTNLRECTDPRTASQHSYRAPFVDDSASTISPPVECKAYHPAQTFMDTSPKPSRHHFLARQTSSAATAECTPKNSQSPTLSTVHTPPHQSRRGRSPASTQWVGSNSIDSPTSSHFTPHSRSFALRLSVAATSTQAASRECIGLIGGEGGLATRSALTVRSLPSTIKSLIAGKGSLSSFLWLGSGYGRLECTHFQFKLILERSYPLHALYLAVGCYDRQISEFVLRTLAKYCLSHPLPSLHSVVQVCTPPAASRVYSVPHTSTAGSTRALFSLAS